MMHGRMTSPETIQPKDLEFARGHPMFIFILPRICFPAITAERGHASFGSVSRSQHCLRVRNCLDDRSTVDNSHCGVKCSNGLAFDTLRV